MGKTAGWYLGPGFKTKGYNLDFEAMLNINGGVEYRIFSDGENVVIIMGESARARTGNGSGVLYHYHCCKIGDNGYLEKVINSEILIKKPYLLADEYREVFSSLIDKIRSYGARDTASSDYHSNANPCPKNRKIFYLSDYRESMSLKNRQRS